MSGKKTTERTAANDGAAEQELDHARSDHRAAARHRTGDYQAPVGIGIPAKDLAGEEHSQRAEKQEDAENPGHFTRVFVGTVEEDLSHVGKHEHDHSGAGIVMERPDEPAQ